MNYDKYPYLYYSSIFRHGLKVTNAKFIMIDVVIYVALYNYMQL